MSVCPNCGTIFSCGMVDKVDDEPCWCMKLPALPAGALMLSSRNPAGDNCFCPDCLQVRISELERDKPEEC